MTTIVNIFIAAFLSISIGFLIFLLTSLFFLLPAEAECLAQGYPETQITWNMKTYCVSIDGDVRAVVVPTEETP